MRTKIHPAPLATSQATHSNSDQTSINTEVKERKLKELVPRVQYPLPKEISEVLQDTVKQTSEIIPADIPKEVAQKIDDALREILDKYWTIFCTNYETNPSPSPLDRSKAQELCEAFIYSYFHESLTLTESLHQKLCAFLDKNLAKSLSENIINRYLANQIIYLSKNHGILIRIHSPYTYDGKPHIFSDELEKQKFLKNTSAKRPENGLKKPGILAHLKKLTFKNNSKTPNSPYEFLTCPASLITHGGIQSYIKQYPWENSPAYITWGFEITSTTSDCGSSNLRDFGTLTNPNFQKALYENYHMALEKKENPRRTLRDTAETYGINKQLKEIKQNTLVKDMDELKIHATRNPLSKDEPYNEVLTIVSRVSGGNHPGVIVPINITNLQIAKKIIQEAQNLKREIQEDYTKRGKDQSSPIIPPVPMFVIIEKDKRQYLRLTTEEELKEFTENLDKATVSISTATNKTAAWENLLHKMSYGDLASNELFRDIALPVFLYSYVKNIDNPIEELCIKLKNSHPPHPLSAHFIKHLDELVQRSTTKTEDINKILSLYPEILKIIFDSLFIRQDNNSQHTEISPSHKDIQKNINLNDVIYFLNTLLRLQNALSEEARKNVLKNLGLFAENLCDYIIYTITESRNIDQETFRNAMELFKRLTDPKLGTFSILPPETKNLSSKDITTHIKEWKNKVKDIFKQSTKKPSDNPFLKALEKKATKIKQSLKDIIKQIDIEIQNKKDFDGNWQKEQILILMELIDILKEHKLINPSDSLMSSAT